jgi:hypothetical protein
MSEVWRGRRYGFATLCMALKDSSAWVRCYYFTNFGTWWFEICLVLAVWIVFLLRNKTPRIPVCRRLYYIVNFSCPTLTTLQTLPWSSAKYACLNLER